MQKDARRELKKASMAIGFALRQEGGNTKVIRHLYYAISVAEDAQLPDNELKNARKLRQVLRQVHMDRKARADLQAAESSRNRQELKSAIQVAEVAGLPEHELDSARKALEEEQP